MISMSTYFHTTTFSAGTYFALPLCTLQSTEVVFSGVGIRRTTLVAESLLLKFVLTITLYVTWLVPISFTMGIILSGNLTFDVERYLEENLVSAKEFRKAIYDNIRHELEFSIGRYKTDRASGIEFVQFHALMEPAIIQLNRINSSVLAFVDNKLVIKTKFALWGSCQVRSH